MSMYLILLVKQHELRLPFKFLVGLLSSISFPVSFVPTLLLPDRARFLGSRYHHHQQHRHRQSHQARLQPGAGHQRERQFLADYRQAIGQPANNQPASPPDWLAGWLTAKQTRTDCISRSTSKLVVVFVVIVVLSSLCLF